MRENVFLRSVSVDWTKEGQKEKETSKVVQNGSGKMIGHKNSSTQYGTYNDLNYYLKIKRVMH